MANHGPAYGLSRECALKSQAKFNLERAKESLTWIEDVLKYSSNEGGIKYSFNVCDDGIRNQTDFAAALKDGVALCELINILCPNAVKRINMGTSAPFKQRENLELFLKGCETYGLKSQDLFQVNDLYENKGLYLVVDCIFAIGGMAQKKGFDGPRLGVKVSDQNVRFFSQEQISSGKTIIGLQYGSNRGATQSGMSFGNSRKILPSEFMRN